jgi:hypothetical protein
MRPRLLAKARRRQTVVLAKDAREVRRMTVADEPCDIAHRDRRLLREQLRRSRHAPRVQVLVEAQLAELRVRTLDLARRARHRARDLCERQPPAIVARDDHA